MYLFPIMIKWVDIKPRIVANQIVVILENITRDVEREILKPVAVNKPRKLPSVTPIPPGRKDSEPYAIEVK